MSISPIDQMVDDCTKPILDPAEVAMAIIHEMNFVYPDIMRLKSGGFKMTLLETIKQELEKYL